MRLNFHHNTNSNKDARPREAKGAAAGALSANTAESQAKSQAKPQGQGDRVTLSGETRERAGSSRAATLSAGMMSWMQADDAKSGETKETENAGATQKTQQNGETTETRGTLLESSKKGFKGWDGDGDGYLTKTEIEKSLQNKNLSPEDKAALETLRGRQQQIESYSNDEYGSEKSGMTLKDLEEFQKNGKQDAKLAEEQYRIEHELATEPDDVKAKALQNRDNPADLKDKFGTRDYYIERYKDARRRNPESAAPDYYLNYGLKYFDRFKELQPTLSPEGQQWLDSTKVKLQEKMEARIKQGDFAALERDPEAFKKFAYDSHPSAYLEGGLSKVPYADRVRIGMTPDSNDLWTKDGLSQAWETGVEVIRQDAEGANQKLTENGTQPFPVGTGWYPYMMQTAR